MTEHISTKSKNEPNVKSEEQNKSLLGTQEKNKIKLYFNHRTGPSELLGG